MTPPERWGILQADNHHRSARTGIEWRPAWIWPDETEDLVADLVEDAPTPVLHVASGSSLVGDIRLDLHHPAADVHADATQLPLESNSVGTVIADPPFTIQDLMERQAWVSEMGRVARDLVILHAPWFPKPSWAEDLREAYIRTGFRHRLPYSPVVISVWEVLSDA